MQSKETSHHAKLIQYNRNHQYFKESKSAFAEKMVHLMKNKPAEFREYFINNPAALLDCVVHQPDQTYSFIKMNQTFFNEGTWVDQSNIKDFMNFSRENPKFLSMVLMPMLLKNLNKARDMMDKYPELKENLKYDFPKEFKKLMEVLNPKDKTTNFMQR